MVLFSDGASRGNQFSNSEAGCGWVIKDGRKTVVSGYEYLGNKTNNEAEYMGFINGMRYAIANNIKIDMAFADSNLLVQQLNGKFKVKAQNLQSLFAIAKDLVSKQKTLIIHIPREKNIEADSLANRAIDEKQ